MERPKPTKELILEVTGYNKRLISAVHHGLYEIPLNDFSTDLNLDEMIVVSAVSWELRRNDLSSVIELVQSKGIYEIFNYFNGIGFPWLNRNKAVSEKLKPLYEQLNPYGKNLEARLQRVHPESVERYMRELKRKTDKYPFKKPEILAAEITEWISGYNLEYEPLKVTKVSPMQPNLF